MAAVGLPGGHAPNRVTEFVAPNPIFSSSQLPNGGAFISNANTPQIADYFLVAGLGFFLASAVTPQGQANAAEYTFGLHAQAIHQAEAVKSSVWKSVPTPPAAAQPVPQRFIWSAPQSIDLTLQGRIQPSAATPPAAAQPAPLRLIFASQEALDLSIGAWVVGGTQANQGPVPLPAITLPQDPTQLAAQIWKSQPAAAVITPNPIATFFSIPPQTEERPTRAVWQSLRAGQTPPVITSFYAAPQQIDLTQQSVVIVSARTPPAIGPVPPITIGTPQADPSQIAPRVWPSVVTPPAIAGVTVWPAIVVPAQFDTSINPSVLWTTSTFSPGITPPAPPVVTETFSGGWEYARRARKRREEELRSEREQWGILPKAAQIVAAVAIRQADALDLDAEQRLEELERELELAGVRYQSQYFELLNLQRQRLIDAEIKGYFEAQEVLNEENKRRLLLLLAFLA
jgi:hypothetical protein